MVYVVPQVANVFAQGNKKLPWLTSMMLMISSFIKQAGGWMFLAGDGCGGAYLCHEKEFVVETTGASRLA